MKTEILNQSGAVAINQSTESVLTHLTTICRQKAHDLKDHIKLHLAAEFGDVLDATKIQQVVNEADALATFTPFPALFFPTLAQEKALAVINWQGKQNLLRANGIPYALAA
jgi:hypothetical protein